MNPTFRNKPATPPYGKVMTEYRTLTVGDTLQAGDEVQRPDLAGNWFILSKQTIGCHRQIHAHSAYVFRRPIRYRLLERDEIIQEGDEWQLQLGSWYRAAADAGRVDSFDVEYLFRRRVSTPVMEPILVPAEEEV